MTALKYVDRHPFTISAIRDYKLMKSIIDAAPARVKEQNGMAVNANLPEKETETFEKSPCSQTERSIESIDLVKKRYTEASEYMEWFFPAWDSLSEQGQKILSEFYMSDSRRSGASIRLQHALNYSDRQLDRLRSSALDELSNFLLGK